MDPSRPKGVYLLHSLHCWSGQELQSLKDTINQIAQQNASAIKYDHNQYVFTLTGSDPKQQKQALDALEEFLDSKAPAWPALPEKRFRDVKRPSPSESSTSELLVDLVDLSTTLAATNIAPPQQMTHSAEVEVDDRVTDPFEMHYADKRQKVDIPTMLAERAGCVATLSEDGRHITITGEIKSSVDKCVVQINRMQEYFLRPAARLAPVTLVYGTVREEFRFFFMPVQEHRFYSKHIKFLPSSMPSSHQPTHFYVIEKAVFDNERGTWVRAGARLSPNNAPYTYSPVTRGYSQPNAGYAPTPQDSQIARASSGSWGSIPASPRAPQAWQSPTPQKQSRQFDYASSSPAGRSPTPQQQSRQYDYAPVSPAGRSPTPQASPQNSWTGSTTPKLPPAQGKIMRVEEPEWASPTFTPSGANDFPSLPMGGKAPPKRSGMPALPPLRIVGGTQDMSRPPTAGSTRSTSSAQSATHSVDSPSSSSLVFGDQEFEFLERQSALHPGRARLHEGDMTGLELGKLRDPAQERADSERTIRRLPVQQVSPLQSSSRPDSSLDIFINEMRTFNMQRLSQAIRAGLRELQGQRQEIRLFGRLGCVLFPATPALLHRPWDITQVESAIVKEHGVRPLFSPVVTTVHEHVSHLFGLLGSAKSESAQFEVICDTRTNPSSRYTQTLVTVPSTVAILDRVVTPWKTFGEVMWNSVDKSQDFEILLQAREGVIHDINTALGRTDVKPFNAFRKKLSIGTHNSHITCHNITNYLEIKSINFRQTRTYDKPGQFSILIHKVEELQLSRTEGLDAVTGRAVETSKRWFELEIQSETMNRRVQQNLSLIPGTVADWQVEDIIGQDPSEPEELAKMVKALIYMVEECDARFRF
ncbi:hypothetical protein BGZ72_005044 [Mortierella alpina]|nr:hypothetical protein BGZ72_005044 [Mortierella alpina]